MKYDFHIVVIGAGSAGLVVASSATSLGAKVALIENDKMGGDCLNVGCVPSKSFLKSAHLAKDIKSANELGLKASLAQVDLSKVMNRVSAVIKKIAPHDSEERFTKMGVKVYRGNAVFDDAHTVLVDGKRITGKYIVIASGSEPMVPPIKGLKEVTYLTNKNIFQLKTLPKHLIVMGGGPIGAELGQGFRHLGSEVTIIDMLPNLFTKDDPEVGPIMEKRFKDDGITLELSAKIIEVKKTGNEIIVVVEKEGKQKEIKGDQLLVALGRIPATKGLMLEKVGVKTNKQGYVVVNSKLQTSVPNIYACGDVVGPYQFTHMAGYQAGIVARNTCFPALSKVDYSAVPWATYTKPEIAHVGYTESWAGSLGIYKDKVIVDLKEVDRAQAEHDEVGFLKLILGKNNMIIGATMVGEKAGEMMPLATMAIKQKLKATAFLSLIFSYPTEAEIFKFASLSFLKKGFKPWQKKLIKKLFVR